VGAVGAYAEGHRTSLALSAGSPGIGVTLGRSLRDQVGVRVSGNFFTYGRTFEETDVTYDGTIKLNTIGGFLDFHPGGSAFRLTGGIVVNNNRVEGTAVPEDTYTLNGTTYSASEVGTLSGVGDLGDRSVAPYAGLGFGRSHGGGRVFVTFDLGVMFQGLPQVSLSANGSLASDPAFQADLAAEESEINDELEQAWFSRYYPVVAIGIGIRF
jgi:hypothetical protein